MISEPTVPIAPVSPLREETGDAPPPTPQPALIKIARVLEEEEGEFTLEYDDTRGQKNTMRLDALTYEGSLREARSFLGIQVDDHDEDGARWSVE